MLGNLLRTVSKYQVSSSGSSQTSGAILEKHAEKKAPTSKDKAFTGGQVKSVKDTEAAKVVQEDKKKDVFKNASATEAFSAS